MAKFGRGSRSPVALLGIIFIVMGSGCGEPPARTAERVMSEMEPDFDHSSYEPESIQGQLVSEDPAFAAPRRIEVVEGHIVVADALSDSVVHVLNRDRQLSRFGSRGQGPGEFVTFAAISAAEQDGRAWLYTLDPSQARLMRISIPTLEIGAIGDRETLRLPGGVFSYELSMLDEDLAVLLGFFPDGRFGLLDTRSGELETFGEVPGIQEHPPVVRQQAYQSVVASAPSGERFALLTRRASRLEIYARDGQLLHAGEGPYEFDVDYESDSGNYSPGWLNRNGYQAVAATEERIFALFSGRAEAHYRGMSGQHAEHIHVFDWNGELQKVIRLDREVLAIAVAEDLTEIYAVTERPQPAVLVFPYHETGPAG